MTVSTAAANVGARCARFKAHGSPPARASRRLESAFSRGLRQGDQRIPAEPELALAAVHREALDPLPCASRRHPQVEGRTAAVAVESRGGSPDETIGECACHVQACAHQLIYGYIYAMNTGFVKHKKNRLGTSGMTVCP